MPKPPAIRSQNHVSSSAIGYRWLTASDLRNDNVVVQGFVHHRDTPDKHSAGKSAKTSGIVPTEDVGATTLRHNPSTWRAGFLSRIGASAGDKAESMSGCGGLPTITGGVRG